MAKDVLLTLITAIFSIIGIIIAGYFSIVVAKIQSSPKNENDNNPRILLPDGVRISKQPSASHKINLWLIVIPLLSTIIGFLVGLSINKSQPTLPARSSGTVIGLMYTLLAFGIIGIIAFVFSVRKRKQLGPKAYSIIGVSTVSLLLLAIASYYVVAQFLEQRTVYILFDASSEYNGLYDGIVAQLDIVANEIPDNVDIALGVFGGNLSGVLGCGDIKELVKPSRKESALRDFDPARILLSQIRPQGNAGIENSVQFAIERLAGRKGIQQIVIITPKIDTTCGMPGKDFIRKLALDAGIDSEIFIISIGDISIEDAEELIKLSDKYEHVGTAEELDNIMRDIFSVPPALYPSTQ
jgi:hypothetical protein